MGREERSKPTLRMFEKAVEDHILPLPKTIYNVCFGHMCLMKLNKFTTLGVIMLSQRAID